MQVQVDALLSVRRRLSMNVNSVHKGIRIRAGVVPATAASARATPDRVLERVATGCSGHFHANSQLTTNPSDQREAALETKISRFGK